MNDEHGHHDNLVLLRGTVSNEPVRRELRNGDVVTQIDLTTRVDGAAISVPVAVHESDVGVGAGDEVVVTGRVSRRFFRAGGQTQSRTEVIAAELIPARRVRTAERAVERLVARLEGPKTAT